MDEKDKKIKELEDKVVVLTKENAEFKDSNTKLGQDIAERDTSIAELKANAKERGEQFKKLKDMTEAEKDLLTEKELELIKRQEIIENERAEEKKTNQEREAKVKEQTIENLANKFAKGNKDLAAQIKINLGKLNPALLEGAITEQDLVPHVESAFRMSGIATSADPLRTAHNADGNPAPINSETDFSTTKEGKDLAGAMGLSQAVTPPPAEGGAQ